MDKKDPEIVWMKGQVMAAATKERTISIIRDLYDDLIEFFKIKAKKDQLQQIEPISMILANLITVSLVQPAIAKEYINHILGEMIDILNQLGNDMLAGMKDAVDSDKSD